MLAPKTNGVVPKQFFYLIQNFNIWKEAKQNAEVGNKKKSSWAYEWCLLAAGRLKNKSQASITTIRMEIQQPQKVKERAEKIGLALHTCV